MTNPTAQPLPGRRATLASLANQYNTRQPAPMPDDGLVALLGDEGEGRVGVDDGKSQ